MNCNCKTELEAKLTERLKSSAPDGTDHSVTLEGYGFGMTPGLGIVMVGCMPFTEVHQTTTKVGAPKTKKRTGSMVFSFCPFCGKSAKAEAAPASQDTSGDEGKG